MLVAFQSLMASFSDPFNQIVNLGARLQEAVGDINRLDDVLRHQSDKSVDQTPPVEKAAKLSGLVELKHVTFGYSRLAPPLIEDFNLSLKPGSRVALVGSSGSGKTTVSRLVAGLYEPWSGEILFDGQPRSQIPRNVMTDSLAMVDQEIFLFEGTLRENLTLWDPTVPDTSIVGAAMDACITKTSRTGRAVMVTTWKKTGATIAAAAPAPRDRSRAGKCPDYPGARRGDQCARPGHRTNR